MSHDKLIEQLRNAMEADGLTQADLAAHLDISQPYVSKLLRGADLSESMERKIRAFLGEVPEESIMDRDELRKAVKSYKWLKEIEEQGCTLVVRDPDGHERVVVFLW